MNGLNDSPGDDRSHGAGGRITRRSHRFSQATGRWTGCSEVYDARGGFLGHGRDRRTIGPRGAHGKVRIEVSFHGPFRLQGHYDVEDRGSYRLYQGPANYGFAEALAPNLVDAHGYWADAGLSQRFFMFVLPGDDKQLSLALMSRGEQLQYCVVGENDRVTGSTESTDSPMHDISPDPAADREDTVLHQPGRWRGALRALGHEGEFAYEERIEAVGDGLRTCYTGGLHAPESASMTLRIDGRQAWSGAGELTGSYSLTGGRALSGTFHRVSRGLRLWRREVATRDGHRKAILHLWYRGQERVGAEFGVLKLEPL